MVYQITLFLMQETVTDAPDRGWEGPAKRKEMKEAWLTKAGRDMRDWDPWTGLEMYMELQVGNAG